MGGGSGKSRKRQRTESSSSATTTATGGESSSVLSFGWKKVEVHLDPKKAKKTRANAAANDDTDDMDDVDAAIWNDNHYDDNDNNEHGTSSLSTRASQDLPGHAKEEMGMFYGLEVMDGNAYTAEKRADGSVHFSLLCKSQKNDGVVVAATSTTSTSAAVVSESASSPVVEQKEEKNKKARKEQQQQERNKKQTATSTTTDGAVPKDAVAEAPPKQDDTAAEAKDNPAQKKKKKQKKKNKDKKQPQSQQDDKKPPRETNDHREEEADEDDEAADGTKQQQEQEQKDLTTRIRRMQTSWTTQTAGVEFHDAICHYLVQADFWTPTPIQAATLPASILGRCNIVGAAPTGSGKTLAFVLPIVQSLLSSSLSNLDNNNNNNDHDCCCLQALILTPTRELTLQIANVCQDLFGKANRRNSTVTIVGGLAHAKQIRILNAKPKPLVCVATPGRLWELISSREHQHLNDLSQLKFLVMDEADRMVQQSSFPQLIHILNAVHQANPMHDESDDEDEGEDDDDDEQDGDGPDHRMLGLPGIPGEAKVQMLNDDILKRLKRQQTHSTKSQDKDDSGSDGSSNNDDDSVSDAMVPQVNEMDDEEFEQQMKAVYEYNPEDDDDNDKIALPLRPPVHRQTFIYSATLTLPSSTSNVQSFRRNNKGNTNRRRGKGGSVHDHVNVDGAIAEILEKANAKGKTKVVDLTNMDRGGGKHTKSVVVTGKNNKETTTTNNSTATKTKAATTTTTNSIKKTAVSSSSFRLPPGLDLQQIKCTQRHKDSHLYGYLMTTKQGLSSGPCLVFCNSIAGVRRVGATLQALGLDDVRILHAQMQQRARFKAVELLGRSNARTVVVATDVAARGLDIPSVASVVHYDAARSVDAFVHRSGRTARGVGPKAVGCSLSLVAPGEDKMHNSTVAALGVKFEDVLMDGRLLKAAQERTNLATKVVQANDLERKNKERSQWFEKQSDEAGLEMDEDILQEGELTDRRDQNLLREAKSARRRLAALLAQPMTIQRYGKFLSTNAAARQEVVIPSTSTTSVTGNARKKRRRRR